MWIMLSYKEWLGWQAAAVVSGVFLGWVMTRWEKAYDEAREAGAVA